MIELTKGMWNCKGEHVLGSPAFITAATCTAGGLVRRACVKDECEHIATVPTPALGHDLTGAIIIAATCATDGSQTGNCTRAGCGETGVTNTLTALGHTWAMTSSTPATCADNRLETWTCTRVVSGTVCGAVDPARNNIEIANTATGAHTVTTWTVTIPSPYPAKSTGTCSTCTTVTRNTQIGDTGPGSGIIYYVNPAGFPVEGYGTVGNTGYFAQYTAHYLEVALSDSSTGAQWGDANTLEISGVTTFTENTDTLASKIGNGRKDTMTIVAHLAAMVVPESGRAAQLASATQGGQNDWFLPSLGELNELYKHYDNNGKGSYAGLTANWYWSSSQKDTGNNAWAQRFNDGYQMNYYKGSNAYVRAIRAF